MKEFWRTVVIDGVEHPRYQVSNMGRVKCIDFRGTGKERICWLSANSDGYLQACIDGVVRKVHRLVAEAFLPCQEKKPEVEHKDTNRANNIVGNLKWVNHKENCNNPLTRKHMSENAAMLGKFGAENHSSVSIVQLTKDGVFVKKWDCARDVDRELGISFSTISTCLRGKTKTAGGFKWVYASDYQRKSISEIKPLF